jgi:tetratricopeptide (TPR) repeat protein
MKMVFPRYETDLFRFKETFHVKQDRSHNEICDVSVTKGIITFFIYCWLIFTVFKIGFDKLKGAGDAHKLMIGGLLAAILAYLIQNQFSFGVVAITSLFWVLWGMVMKSGQEEPLPAQRKNISLGEIPWLPATGIVIIALFLIYISFLSFRGDILFKSGKTNLELRRLPQAVEDLKESIRVFPFEGTEVSHLAITYLNMGNPTDAIKTLNYGLGIDAYNADNFYMLARVYLSAGDLTEAQKNAEIAIKIDPYYAEVFQTLGQIYERRGDRQTAAEMFKKTFMINPNLGDAMRDLERVASPGEVLRAFEEAYTKYSDNPVVLEKIGRLYLDRGQVDKGAKIADRMVSVDPQNVMGYLLVGDAALKRGEIDRAFEAFQQVVLLEPNNVSGHNGLAVTYLKKGNRQRAQEESDLAKKLLAEHK